MTTPNEPGPFDRLSSYIGGLGLGITAGAIVAGAFISRGRDVPWGLVVCFGLGGAGALPAAEWAARFTFALILAGLHAYETANRSRPPKPQPPTAPPQGPIPDPEREEREWSNACYRFFLAGELLGNFAEETFTGILGPKPWARMQKYYTSPEGLEILTDYGSNKGTDWSPGWTFDDVEELRAKGALPHPGGRRPDIEIVSRSAAQRSTQKKRRPNVRKNREKAEIEA